MASPDEPHLLSPRGFAANGVAAGLKRSGRLDCGLLVCTTDRPATAACAFTQNLVVAAPIVVGREHVASGRLRGVAVNSGNANACTGRRGLADARSTCRHVSRLLGCRPEEVLPSSTGIIGRELDMPRLLGGFEACAADLGDSAEHAERFMGAILTTDLVTKHAAASLRIGRKPITVAGVCKGSGMIGPMLNVDGPERAEGAARTAAPIAKVPPQATMLAFITTDAAATPAVLRRLLATAVQRTFNRVTVDNHASTNDTAAILASGASGVSVTDPTGARRFADALTDVCDRLSYQIAADGEGASKAVVVRVTGARSESQAERLARAIADSPLVKTALHGNDPNWGRVVSIAGMAAAHEGLAFDPDVCVLKLCGVAVFRRGAPVDFDAAAVSERMKQRHVEIDLNCRIGKGSAHVYTCDLSRDYIRINADYST